MVFLSPVIEPLGSKTLEDIEIAEIPDFESVDDEFDQSTEETSSLEINEDFVVTRSSDIVDEVERPHRQVPSNIIQQCIHGFLVAECRECCPEPEERDASLSHQSKSSKVCIHNKIKYTCIECGGKSICIHKRIKYNCKECRGSNICIHKRLKYTCKECGGDGICIHQRVKYQCKECKGSGLCIHKRQKFHCKKC